MTESLLNKAAQAKHITNSESALDLYRKVTGLIHATQEMMESDTSDWYIPVGAYLPSENEETSGDNQEETTKPTKEEVQAHVGEEVVEGENDQFDLDKDGDIDADDVELANSEIIVNEDTAPYIISTTKPTAESIAQSIDANATKPTEEITLDMNGLTGPTTQYIVYPIDWEVVENDQLVSPVIKDENNFEIGTYFDDETPTIEVNEVTYRILDVELGKGTYKLVF